MNRDEIRAEFDKFIEFPDGSDGKFVTTVSAQLFAEHVAEMVVRLEHETRAKAMAMTHDELKALALRHGFTERLQPDGGMDLNPYVYEVLEKVLRIGELKARQELNAELLTLNKWKGLALAKDGDGRTVAEVEKDAAARERAACLRIVEAPHWKQIVSSEMRRRADVIRARG